MTTRPTSSHGRGARLQALSLQLQRARADERALLAQELHDELGALLLAAKLDLAGLRARCPTSHVDMQARFDHMAGLLDDGLALKTRVVEGLRPGSALEHGLRDAVMRLAKAFELGSGTPVQIKLNDLCLRPDAQVCVYRFVQECLTNIGKHAHATAVRIDGWETPRQVGISVSDDGIGFGAADISASAHGIEGMRRRLEKVHGALTIESGAGTGARFVAVLPRASHSTGNGMASARSRTQPSAGAQAGNASEWPPTH